MSPRRPEFRGRPASFPRRHLKFLENRPLLVAIAGPNGAGKTTYYQAYLKPAGLRFLNADEISRELKIDAYEAARVITELRRELAKQGESYIFETVFSDPAGDKLAFLKSAAQVGYTVALSSSDSRALSSPKNEC